MTGKTIGIIVVVVIAFLGGWLLFSGTPANPVENQVSNGASAPTNNTSIAGMTIAYTASGFSPANVTIPLGTTITFVNQTSDRMWAASAMHPTHEVYDGTALEQHCAAGYAGEAPFDQCAATESYNFTFTKAGDWKYHNHANTAHFGSIVVTP
ncbi:hypothetical protein A3C94_01890 [Candidatus Kaiserbacteria bacterium RIFCSPHIGHO2_02_FULL_55_17]|uniref:EfeO-type cupredoxin-like domain-containing protein n=1 Tax=Candidatus Kaiserbacteria bacterium RIFCSPHIGHO2_02_FULL_55_17 TaxID=1798496 RepID=A0A1F6DT14_9BACT|nr:MAG: hypothetical protein A3C94_01890 [Candidatus Kaiserbacteria bacterium RIFCSPHIGHO2_02_FULL_55_17]